MALAKVQKSLKRVMVEMVAFARDAWMHRQVANLATKKQRDAEKSLERLMLASDVLKFEVQANGQQVEVEFGQFPVEVVDVHELRQCVDDETFMLIVQATKKAVEAFADHEVLAKCTKTTMSGPRLRLKEKEVTK